MSADTYRSGMVVLAGRPNVGKSTLANALSGVHLVAVSPRPQTTRRRIAMAVHGDGWQAVLLDVPGFQTPRDGLTRRMQSTVDQTLGDCDAAIVMLNAEEEIGAGDRFIAERVKAAGLPTIVVINKTDATNPGAIALAVAQAADLVPDFHAIHPVSALTGDGLDALRVSLPEVLPPGPAYFPEGLVTDQTPDEVAAELIREAALVRLRQEVPHSLAVQIEDISATRGGGVRCEAVILVETDSQKGIVVGKGGEMSRDIGTAARKALDLDATCIDALMVMGDVAYDAGRMLEAAKHFETLVGRSNLMAKEDAVRVLVRFLEATGHSPLVVELPTPPASAS